MFIAIAATLGVIGLAGHALGSIVSASHTERAAADVIHATSFFILGAAFWYATPTLTKWLGMGI